MALDWRFTNSNVRANSVPFGKDFSVTENIRQICDLCSRSL